MPEGLQSHDTETVDRDRDAYGWALTRAARLRASLPENNPTIAFDAADIVDFLEEWADDMLAGMRSQLVDLMAHAAKTALSRNPDVIGHWRTELSEFHDRLVDGYRPSMRSKIDLDTLWQRACRKVAASFADHDEPPPGLPVTCPFALDPLIDPNLDFDELVQILRHDHSENP